MVNDASDSAEALESTSPNSESSVSTAVFDLLSDQRRRYVLHCLRTYDNPMQLADVADEIAVLERDTVITDIPAEDVKRVYISLYHTHVPKLVDAGVVEYSQERDAVALTERATELQSQIDALSE